MSAMIVCPQPIAAEAGREREAVAEKSSCARAPLNRVLPNRRRTAPIRLLASAASTMIAMIAITSNAKPA